MADTFQLQVATPERLLIDEQVTEAQLPAKNGYIGVLAGHAPLVSALGAGVLTYEGGTPRILAVAGGFIEILENHVRVLVDHAEFAEDIQPDRARRELEQGTDALKKAQTEHDVELALAAIGHAQARLDAAGHGTAHAA